jgi:hypothetical protein
MKKSLFIIYWGLFSFSLMGQTPSPAPTSHLALADVNTIDGIISNLYKVISGPMGARRDWNLMRSLFRSEARLNSISRDKDGKSRFLSMTMEDYIRNTTPLFDSQGFFEKEIGRTVEQYGDVAQVFSAYETRKEENGPIDARGVNSIQLVYKDDRYWILNIIWNRESEKNPIPAKYLKK